MAEKILPQNREKKNRPRSIKCDWWTWMLDLLDFGGLTSAKSSHSHMVEDAGRNGTNKNQYTYTNLVTQNFCAKISFRTLRLFAAQFLPLSYPF